MADYKDMLKETLNNLGEMAKDITDTATEKAREFTGTATDFAKEFKDTATDFAKEFKDTATEKAREFTGAAAEKAKDFSDAANEKAKSFSDDPVKDLTDKAKKIRTNTRLAFEASGVNEDLKKVYMEIGKLYYETSDAESGSYFEPLFRKARKLNEQLDELNRQMSEDPAEPDPETVIAEEAVAGESSSEE